MGQRGLVLAFADGYGDQYGEQEYDQPQQCNDVLRLLWCHCLILSITMMPHSNSRAIP